MTFLEERDIDHLPNIPEYYRGKTIFITGGTGFLGKVLIEKLLFSCQYLDRIYLLLRPKKGVNPQERLSDVFAARCFDRLRKERPGIFESKVFFISGDCAEVGLGLSTEDRAEIITRTHIIFHAAASVRFDDSLQMSVKLNLQGTREVIELAKEMHNLECFVHVSTSYANTNRDHIDEVIYPPHDDWRDLLQICENTEAHTLNVLTPKYIGEMPNTYVFVKQLAEHLVYEQKGKLPVVIIRPSIVVSSHSEPDPGWIENFNGPIGLMAASSKGILRSICSDPNVTADFIPVDLVIKSFVVASWIRGTKKLELTDDIPIYNSCSSSMGYSVTYEELITIGQKTISSFPLDNMIWTTGGTITTIKFLHIIKVLLLHVLPAILLDAILWILGKKTMVLKIHRRIYSANIALQLFLIKAWTFSIKNYLSLCSKIKEEDKEHFYYIVENVDLNEYFKNAIIGARRYLFKEKDEDLPKARAHYRRVTLLDKIIKCMFFGYIFWRIIHSSYARNLFEYVS